MNVSASPRFPSVHIQGFIDGGKISKLIDLVSLEEDVLAYVVGFFFGVSQGVEIFFDDDNKSDPRYRLKIKVGDELEEIEFVMYDDVVKKFTPITYTKFGKKNGCLDIYPQEVEQYIGDPMLFKVRKDYGCDSCGAILVQVLDVLIDTNIIEVYLDPSLTAYSQNVKVGQPVNSQVVDSEVYKAASFASKIRKVVAPSIQLDSSIKIIGSSVKTNCSILDEFIGDLDIKRLTDLIATKDSSSCIVVGWYDSVCEGVDMWYSDPDFCDEPRFRLKINVRDEIGDTTFVLFDQEVKKPAFETCDVLSSIGEDSSMYPNECDVLYGDAILFKVINKAGEVGNVAACYEVVGTLTDPKILDKFFEYYMPCYGVDQFFSRKLSPIRVFDMCSSTESEKSSGKSSCVESKRKAEYLCESTVEVDGNKYGKHPKII